jgi:hypothetical protein
MKDGYADDLSLDRIDVNKNYSKDNCRWVDNLVQSNNTTRNRLVTYEGQTLTLAELCREYDLDYDLVKNRLRNGLPIEEAVKPPKQKEKLTYDERTMTVAEWAEEKGMTYFQLKKRLMRGWTVEKALNQPIRRRKA